APAGVEKTAAIVELENAIKEAGEVVRKLKTEKVTGDALQNALAELVAKKEALTAEVAKLGGAASPAASPAKKAPASPAPVAKPAKEAKVAQVKPEAPVAVDVKSANVPAAAESSAAVQYLWSGWGWIIRD
ncbi:hypothetical protein HDU99_007890, partial [Rhizoclosmatium hyalinum]